MMLAFDQSISIFIMLFWLLCYSVILRNATRMRIHKLNAMKHSTS